ncbi:hypothetical protein QCA50_002195 [Cerrena zonata]|uniref:Uncharacterized protein n=1 Tax=Cerrena zonata TaxID=2478898 RepID=A0AAW0GXJ2_9APHY
MATPVASDESRFLLFGGVVDNRRANDVYSIDPTSFVYQRLHTTGDSPGPRCGHTGVLYWNSLIVWGGETRRNPSDSGPLDKAVYILDLETLEWHRIAVEGESPEARSGHVAAVVDKKMYMFGGQSGDGRMLEDLWVLHLTKCDVDYTARWYQVEPVSNGPPALMNASWAKHNEWELILFGGTDDQYSYNDIWIFSAPSCTWEKIGCTGSIPIPREGHGAAVTGDTMYVFGGRAPDGKFLNDLTGFQVANKQWKSFTRGLGPPPSSRSEHTMVTRKNQIYVLGGFNTDPEDPTTKSKSPKDSSCVIHVLDTDRIFSLPSLRGAPPRRKV